MEFDFVLIHRPGETNALPETLRKLPWPKAALLRAQPANRATQN